MFFEVLLILIVGDTLQILEGKIESKSAQGRPR